MSARRRQTSMLQFEIMVAFMEQHGDLCKPRDGPRGKMRTLALWEQLTQQLNSNGSGDTKTEEKWKKVWSDLKNNIKKKAAKIGREARQTGGGPAYQGSLTDLEQRVIQIIGPRSVTGLDNITEAGLDEEDESPRERARVSVQDAPILGPVAFLENDWSGVEVSRASTNMPQTVQRYSTARENDWSGVEVSRASNNMAQTVQRYFTARENGADNWSGSEVEVSRASTSTAQTVQRYSTARENGKQVTDTPASATGLVTPTGKVSAGQPHSQRSASPELITPFNLKRVAVSPPGQRRKKMRRQLQSSKVDAAAAAFIRSDEAYNEREKARLEREAQRDAHQLRLEERRLDLDERRLRLEEEWQRLANTLVSNQNEQANRMQKMFNDTFQGICKKIEEIKRK